MQVLIIDDSRVTRLLMRRTIEALGFSVIEAGGGTEGLNRLQSQTIDLVLVDANMPDMDGVAVIRALRVQQPAVPTLLVTAENDAELLADGLTAGANACVKKPFDRETIRQQLQTLGLLQSCS